MYVAINPNFMTSPDVLYLKFEHSSTDIYAWINLSLYKQIVYKKTERTHIEQARSPQLWPRRLYFVELISFTWNKTAVLFYYYQCLMKFMFIICYDNQPKGAWNGGRRAHHKHPLILHPFNPWIYRIDVTPQATRVAVQRFLVETRRTAPSALQILLQWDTLFDAAQGERVVIDVEQRNVEMWLDIGSWTYFIIYSVTIPYTIHLLPCPFGYIYITLEKFHNL